MLNRMICHNLREQLGRSVSSWCVNKVRGRAEEVRHELVAQYEEEKEAHDDLVKRMITEYEGHVKRMITEYDEAQHMHEDQVKRMITSHDEAVAVFH